MNYYPMHIGDYAAHTGHLDPLEDIAYRRMLDAYYLAEGPLPLDVERVCRLIRMRDHAAIVRDVLNEFFIQTDEGWRHARCDAEIERKQEKSDKARASASLSVQARAAKAEKHLSERSANAEPTLSDRSTDVVLPIANSQEPITKSQEKERESVRKRPPAARACQIPEGFPGGDEFAWCLAERPAMDPLRIGVSFRDYHLARGSTMKDWSAAWRTWVRNERGAQARASPYQSAADAREKRDAEFMHNLTGGLAGAKTHRNIIDADDYESAAVRRIA